MGPTRSGVCVGEGGGGLSSGAVDIANEKSNDTWHGHAMRLSGFLFIAFFPDYIKSGRFWAVWGYLCSKSRSVWITKLVIMYIYIYIYTHTHTYTHYVSGTDLPASFQSGSLDLRADRLWLTVHVSRCRCRMLRFTCQSWFKQLCTRSRTSLREVYVTHTADQPACHYAVDRQPGDPAECRIQNKEFGSFTLFLCLFLRSLYFGVQVTVRRDKFL